MTVNPNLPSPGRMWNISWLQGRIPADDVQKANVDNPKQAEAYGIQARNLKRLADQGTRIVPGTERQHAVGSARAALDIAVNARLVIA